MAWEFYKYDRYIRRMIAVAVERIDLANGEI